MLYPICKAYFTMSYILCSVTAIPPVRAVFFLYALPQKTFVLYLYLWYKVLMYLLFYAAGNPPAVCRNPPASHRTYRSVYMKGFLMSVKSKRNASGVSLTKQINRKQKHSRVNWHEAASCAIRINLLVIKKLTDQVIPKNIARIFGTFNLFEIKGVGSSLSMDAYYKTIGYAGLLIDQTGKKNQYSSLDVSLSFLSCYYPRKLMKHLRNERNERNVDIEKISQGVYHINKETFSIQIIVTKELPPEENLYLHFLTDRMWNGALAEKLTDDYKEHQEAEIYRRYLHQVMTANTKEKGAETMYICEGLLNFFGTSSDEIIERTKKEDEEYYQPKIDSLSSEIEYLKSLLRQNNIPFHPERAGDTD